MDQSLKEFSLSVFALKHTQEYVATRYKLNTTDFQVLNYIALLEGQSEVVTTPRIIEGLQMNYGWVYGSVRRLKQLGYVITSGDGVNAFTASNMRLTTKGKIVVQNAEEEFTYTRSNTSLV